MFNMKRFAFSYVFSEYNWVVLFRGDKRVHLRFDLNIQIVLLWGYYQQRVPCYGSGSCIRTHLGLLATYIIIFLKPLLHFIRESANSIVDLQICAIFYLIIQPVPATYADLHWNFVNIFFLAKRISNFMKWLNY